MITVFCDGSIQPPNPGGHGYTGWVAKNLTGEVIYKHSDDLGTHKLMSNNVAEYMAVASALQWLIANKLNNHKVSVRTDSQLIVRQLCGIYECHAPHLKGLKDMCLKYALQFGDTVQYIWIPRDSNWEADEMSKSLWYDGRRMKKLRKANRK